MATLADGVFALTGFVHMLVWIFVAMAWLHPAAAAANLLAVIPLIYLLHMLPFHVLTSIKQSLHPATWEQDNDRVMAALVIPDAVEHARDGMFSKSFANPLSPQGMLIFGAITSAWALHLHGRS